jgi:hypothetical protein
MVLISGDAGSGADFGGLLQDLYDQDNGSSLEEIQSLTRKGGADMRLRGYQGQVGIPDKEVSI